MKILIKNGKAYMDENGKILSYSNTSGNEAIEGVSVDNGKLVIADTNMPIQITGSDEEIEIKYSTKTQKIKIGTYSDVYLSDETLHNVITATNLEPQHIEEDIDILGVKGALRKGAPIELATTEEMEAVLVSANVGKIYKFVGETNETFTNGNLYQVMEVE